MRNYVWHDTVWQQLWQQPERLPHALLLHGPEGTGKRQFARAVAARVLCQSPATDGYACGHCASCHWLEQDSHPDFFLLSPDSGEEAEAEGDKPQKRKSAWITVEQVRGLVDLTALSKHQGGWRVVIVEPAEQLNLNAANALLKTLEEPSERTLFLLVSSRLNRVMPTIRSRCLKLALPAPDLPQAESWLREQGVAQSAALLHEAGGAPLLALDLAEPAYREQADWLLQSLVQGPQMDALLVAEKLQDMPIATCVDIVQKWLFDLLQTRLVKAGRFYPGYANNLQALVKSVNLNKLTALMETAQRIRRSAYHPLNARLVQEELLLGYQALFQGHR